MRRHSHHDIQVDLPECLCLLKHNQNMHWRKGSIISTPYLLRVCGCVGVWGCGCVGCVGCVDVWDVWGVWGVGGVWGVWGVWAV